MERLRVLFVIDHFGRGGAERQLLNLVNNIDRERFEPYVFIAERRGERYVELKKDVGVYGMIDSNERQTLRACRRLRDAISTLKPHVVQAWLEYSVFLSAVALKTVARRPSFFASLRTSIKELYDYEVKWGRLKRKILLWAYRQSDAVTVNSRYLRSQLEGYGVKGVEVVYNGINTETFGELPSKKQLRKTLGLSEDVYYIVFVGALVRRKGIEHLVRAVKNIRRSNFCALIIGDGEMKNEITKLVRGDERFRLMGYIPGAVQLVKASDLLVLPSVYEGLPNVILEAMAVGTPVIGTDVYGIPELIENGVNGILISPAEPDGIGAAIEMVMDNSDMAWRFTEVSKEKVKFFNIKRMVEEYERLYLRLLNGRTE